MVFEPTAYWHPEEGYFVLYPSDESENGRGRLVLNVATQKFASLPEGAQELRMVKIKKFRAGAWGSSKINAASAAGAEVNRLINEAEYRNPSKTRIAKSEERHSHDHNKIMWWVEVEAEAIK